MNKVYLAGPITGLDFKGCTDWRKEFIKELSQYNITGISPMRYKDYLADTPGPIKDRYDGHSKIADILSSAKGISYRDKWDIMRCDVIFVNLIGTIKVSIGTMLEVGMATAIQKPIILAIDDVNIHQHSMLETYAGWIVSDLEDGLETIKALLL